MKLSKMILAAALLGSVTIPALADTTTPTTATGMTKLGADELVVLAHEHAVNTAEITMGKLAIKNSTRDAVKAYGKELVDDHTKADADLKDFANTHDAVIGKDFPLTEAEKQATKDDEVAMMKLATLKGPAFDKQFLPMMIAGHQKEMARVDMYLAQVQTDALKSLLHDIKPVMQKHADDAYALQPAPATSMK